VLDRQTRPGQGYGEQKMTHVHFPREQEIVTVLVTGEYNK